MPIHRRLRSPLLIGLIGLLGLLAALACASPPPVAVDSGELVFWEVRLPGAATPTAYLLGTVHYGRDGFAFDPAIRRALDGADVLVLELDPSELDPLAMGPKLARLGVYTDGRTLRDVLEPETVAKLEAYLAARSIEPAPYLRMEPWVVLMALEDAAIQGQGYASDRGIDLTLAAVAQHTPVRGLETLDEQLEAFDTLPAATQEALLLGLVDAENGEGASDDEMAPTMELLFDAWEKGDLGLLERIALDEEGDATLAPYYEALFYARNRRMTERLEQQLGTGQQLFVAIGSAHLVGRDNVVLGLRERGFDVRRVARSAAPAPEED